MIGSNIAEAQTFYKSIAGKFDYFTTDNLGNVYTIVNNEIVKYNAKGEYFARYSNKNFGRIYYVDVSNPLKVVLLFKDFSQIIFLDNMLSESSAGIRLEDMQLEQSTLACSSFNNGLWIYNAINFELRRVNENFVQTNQTLNINQLMDDFKNPESMIENSGYLYLTNPEIGIFVFDTFGTFVKIIPIKGLHSIQVRDDFIYYYTDNKLFNYNKKDFVTNEILLPVKNTVASRVEKGKLFIQTDAEIQIYNLD